MSKPMSQTEFIESCGNRCPNCTDTNLDHSGTTEYDDNVSWIRTSCESCGAEYNERYQLVGYGNLEVPEELIKTPVGILDSFSQGEQLTILQAALSGLDCDDVLDILDIADPVRVRIRNMLHKEMSDEVEGEEHPELCDSCHKYLGPLDIDGGRCTACGTMITSK